MKRRRKILGLTKVWNVYAILRIYPAIQHTWHIGT